jgi:GH24 family phage-related lysozyme (muramidase)
MNTIRSGSTGADVSTWQGVLGVTQDGAFGPATDAATKAWQRAHGLPDDGVVGPRTWAVAGYKQPDPAPMAADTRARFVPFTAPLEGVVPWMYLDVKGLVTVAIGILIDPVETALGLPFVKKDGTAATREEIAAEWTHVKATTRLAHQGHRAAEHETKLRLTDAGVEQVVFAKLDEMWGALSQRFPEIATWPADAQLATLSMAWACGPWFKFGTLETALRARDFATAAGACMISEAGNAGIAPRNKANRELYLAAAKVESGGG